MWMGRAGAAGRFPAGTLGPGPDDVQVVPTLRRAAVVLALAIVPLVAACGDDAPAPTAAPSGPAARGEALARDRGCAGCHSPDGSREVGPTWQDLAGSDVPLDDGTTVVADADYLRRSIEDPGAQRVEGFTVRMPEVSLSDDEIDDLIAHIESLADRPG